MNRSKKLFMWGEITEDEYRFELTQLHARLAEMKPPQHHQVFAAGDLLQNFGLLWQNARMYTSCGPDGCRVRMTDKALVVTWLHPHYQHQAAYA